MTLRPLGLLIAVAAAALAQTVTIGVPSSSGPAQQPVITLSIAAAYPADISGTITLAFASSVGGDDLLVRFSNGTRTLNFTIPAGQTQAVFSPANPAVMIGTVAGTITLTVSLSSLGNDITPNPAPSKTITVTPTVPLIQTVNLAQGSGGFNVVVTGFSSTRDMVSGLFHFAPATNSSISQPDITVQLGAAFSTWYQSPASYATGSQFTLTVPFTVTNGNAGSVVAVTVTLTNSKGTSNPANPH
jgi:hypothetical protein